MKFRISEEFIVCNCRVCMSKDGIQKNSIIKLVGDNVSAIENDEMILYGTVFLNPSTKLQIIQNYGIVGKCLTKITPGLRTFLVVSLNLLCQSIQHQFFYIKKNRVK